jgi:hypothetical protein
VASSDVGSWLAFVVTATGSGTPGSWVYESTGPAAAAIPINRSAPTVSTNTQDGQILSSTNGSWPGTMPITGYKYQWDRCNSAGGACAMISGATSSTYPLTDGDVGHTIEIGVEAINSQGTGGATTCPGASPCPVFSKASALITPGNIGAPSISGTAQEGQTLSESHGSWKPSSSTLGGYQWESCDASGVGCVAIPGATAQTYKLTSSDVGHTVVVQETASSNGATSSPAASLPTGVVQAAPSASGGSGGNPGGSSGGNPGGGSGGNPGSVKPVPTPVSTPGVVKPTVQLRGLVANTLAVHGGAAQIRALLKRGGYAFTFSAPFAGRLVISWYRVQHHHRMLVATVSVRLRKSGKAKIELKLTRAGRNLLKAEHRLTLAAQGGFTPVGQGTTSASRTITLIR